MFHYLLSDEFESQKNLDADLILFVRRFKLIGLANKSTIPENLLGSSSAQIPVKTIANQMKKNRGRFRLKGGFDAKKRKKTLVDDPEIIFQVQNYFELDENSSHGDRVRNVVKIDGIDVQRRYLKMPIDVIARKFLAQFAIPFLSLSTVKRIVRTKLKYLTIPTKRIVCKFNQLQYDFKRATL